MAKSDFRHWFFCLVQLFRCGWRRQPFSTFRYLVWNHQNDMRRWQVLFSDRTETALWTDWRKRLWRLCTVGCFDLWQVTKNDCSKVKSAVCWSALHIANTQDRSRLRNGPSTQANTTKAFCNIWNMHFAKSAILTSCVPKQSSRVVLLPRFLETCWHHTYSQAIHAEQKYMMEKCSWFVASIRFNPLQVATMFFCLLGCPLSTWPCWIEFPADKKKMQISSEKTQIQFHENVHQRFLVGDPDLPQDLLLSPGAKSQRSVAGTW